MANIRVSEWAAGEIRKRAKEEGRTVVSVVDRLLGKPTDEVITYRYHALRFVEAGAVPKELKYEREE